MRTMSYGGTTWDMPSLYPQSRGYYVCGGTCMSAEIMMAMVASAAARKVDISHLTDGATFVPNPDYDPNQETPYYQTYGGLWR